MRFDPGLKLTPDSVAVFTGNGQPAVGAHWHLTDEEFEQVRQGFRCVVCMEPYNEPFPETCIICEFPIRERQAEEIERQMQGHVVVEDPADHIDYERENYEKRTESGIYLP